MPLLAEPRTIKDFREWLDCEGGGSTGNNGCGRGFFSATDHYSPSHSGTFPASFYQDLGIKRADQLIANPPICLRVLGQPSNAFAGGFQN